MPPKADGRPIICIVIDDLGVMRRGTDRVLAMPAPLTLSWFPFARNLPEQVAEGLRRGHEATLHMPMQSFSNSTYQTGPDPLRIDLAPEVNLARLRAAMAAVPSTVGLNNHMGSVATHDANLMALVAHEAREQGFLFLDSLTIGGSQGFKQADAAGVPAASRDIFIDDKNNPAAIQAALLEIEGHARKHGNVIAIGHPRPHTVDALEAWLPTLAPRGFVLWPLAATVALRLEERNTVPRLRARTAAVIEAPLAPSGAVAYAQAMWDEPYLETCCRSALHRLTQCDGIGRPPGLKDGPCLARLAEDGLAVERADGRYEITDPGRARHASEILHIAPRPTDAKALSSL